MRSRTVREGSVGLLLLVGLGLFVGLFLWLRGISVGKRSYKALVEFANAGGMQNGAVVRYRGVKVGKISAIRPGPNGVEVEMEISPADLIIPSDVLVEANQSGLISEVSIDITPQKQLPVGLNVANPLEQNCDRTVIICDGSRLQGQIGISVDQLFRSTNRLASIYGDPRLYESFNSAAKNASSAAVGVTQLTRDLSGLSKATKQQLGNFSDTAASVKQAANQLTISTNKTVNQFGATADQIRLTAAQANRLVTNLDNLLTTNRGSLVTTLNNLSQTSSQIRDTVNSLTPTLNRVTQGKLVQNLETLSENAAELTTNLRNATKTLNNPSNLLVLQQTLDAARVTFQNAQKITSDLDELTGDPKLRENLRRLINGLSGLVSSTQQLQQQVQVAQTLDSVKAAVNKPEAGTLSLGANKEVISINPPDTAVLHETSSGLRFHSLEPPAESASDTDSLLQTEQSKPHLGLRAYEVLSQGNYFSDFTIPSLAPEKSSQLIDDSGKNVKTQALLPEPTPPGVASNEEQKN